MQNQIGRFFGWRNIAISVMGSLFSGALLAWAIVPLSSSAFPYWFVACVVFFLCFFAVILFLGWREVTIRNHQGGNSSNPGTHDKL